jgi:hypothetical protein
LVRFASVGRAGVATSDGSPSPIEKETAADRLHLLRDVDTFNLHWHLPQLGALGNVLVKLDVLARQKIDLILEPVRRQRRAAFEAVKVDRAMRKWQIETVSINDIAIWANEKLSEEGKRQPHGSFTSAVRAKT